VKADGTVLACGQNAAGQLGDGTTTARPAPVAVGGLGGVAAVAAGDAHSLAVKADGTVWAWGQNTGGQLGDGTTTARAAPGPVGGLATATAVAAGAAHRLARLADGTVRAWGANAVGQLGDGTTTQRNAPVAVAGLQGVDRLAARANGSLARPTVTAERYAYDAEGMRVRRVGADGTRVYLGGGTWEERPGDNGVGPASWVVRVLYTLQGRAVAQQENRPGSVYTGAGRVSLYGDHLGSVSATTDAAGQVLSRQDFTPWGEVRSGGVGQTTVNFTGQRKDDTGLLFYGSRYYDPKLGRFLSPDSVAPNKALPQSRNRYSYVLNNPLRYVDPTGHRELDPGEDPKGVAPPTVADEAPPEQADFGLTGNQSGGSPSPAPEADPCSYRECHQFDPPRDQGANGTDPCGYRECHPSTSTTGPAASQMPAQTSNTGSSPSGNPNPALNGNLQITANAGIWTFGVALDGGILPTFGLTSPSAGITATVNHGHVEPGDKSLTLSLCYGICLSVDQHGGITGVGVGTPGVAISGQIMLDPWYEAKCRVTRAC